MRMSVVRGIGTYLPERIMTNHDFDPVLQTSDEWIRERTGITKRHIAAEGEVTSDLGAKAAEAALKASGFTPEDIDLIIVGTTTPDDTMPSTATRVQAKLGMTNGAAFDVNAACSGFVYAMTVADSMLKSGAANRALVIGAETYSRILDWTDRTTCVLFGDGAGAVVLEAQEGGNRGVLYTRIHSEGQYGDLLQTTGGVSRTKTAGVLTMAGKEIFRHGVAKMSECVAEGVKEAGLTLEDIDLLVPHQANIRILNGVAQKLGLPPEKLIITVPEHANTSAASIPLALKAAEGQNKLKAEKIIVLTALGAGLTWGTCIIRW